MSNVRQKIEENRKVSVYKQLLLLLGEYCNNTPMSSVERLFQKLCDGGAKLLPKDSRALDMLYEVSYMDEQGTSGVHRLLNSRFSDLQFRIRPMYKSGRRTEIAFWCRDGYVSDKVLDLINFDERSGAGFWSDAEGKKVSLIDKDPYNSETTQNPR